MWQIKFGILVKCTYSINKKRQSFSLSFPVGHHFFLMHVFPLYFATFRNKYSIHADFTMHLGKVTEDTRNLKYMVISIKYAQNNYSNTNRK